MPVKLVKICGITRLEDAEAAVACGADALGFVFWPKSPRCIDSHRARAIVSSLPPFVTPVGVFVDQPAEEINRIASAARLGAVQLHGNESPDSARSLDLPVVKAVAVGSIRRGNGGRVAGERHRAARRSRSGPARRHGPDGRLGGGGRDRTPAANDPRGRTDGGERRPTRSHGSGRTASTCPPALKRRRGSKITGA